MNKINLTSPICFASLKTTLATSFSSIVVLLILTETQNKKLKE